MLSSEEGENDVFFDSLDCLSIEEPVLAKQGLECGKLEYEIWMNEPGNVKERRERFLLGMDLVEFANSSRIKDLQRITECSDAVLSSSCPSAGNGEGSIADCDRKLMCEANLLLDESTAAALESENKVFEQQETQQHLDESEKAEVNRKKFKKWWKHFSSMRKVGESRGSSKTSKPSFKVCETNRVMVQSNKKGYMEFSALYMGQEIQAHKGFIWTMKFSPDGQYLASGGEDGVVRIWCVMSTDAFSKPLMAEHNLGRSMGKGKFGFGREKLVDSQVVIPNKIFRIEESPIQELHGHGSDVLDVAWSRSNFLISSSMDKTVRLWKVGCNQCLNVFHHNNYVTCIQFNPIDDSYFISGSIDGKVRIWGVSETRVVHWVDVWDIVTAICYRPDGKEFIAGSIRGTCHFYQVSGDDIILEAEIHIHGRKKTSGNKITSIQYSQDEPHKVMITSKDSKLRILDGVDTVRKFKGLPKSRSQMSASFTSTGRHIISVGEDCRVYVWNYDDICPRTSKHTKSVSSCEHFFCEDVSVAIPWLGQGSDQRHSDRSLRGDQIEGTSWIRDSQRFSLGNWFSIDGSCKGSATWPEEKLMLWEITVAEDEYYSYEQQQLCHNYGDYHATLPETWGLVIVAGGRNGRIKTFHNYGLPVSL
ncbi:hypothetical protein ERO13_D10G106000v2 [Gossypium hirsutum]|uniref:Protein tipD isoform X2 n=1 Tax=Gossypium hirsutum TaxID=3635 RepID=A0A1U8K8G3_GOSHI|nr:protein tipD isoform X2 [Gossypium hirsutum]KAG4125599.1 hypothetical protein ERO13_D10G106000v2 [Gossypium hirsutum]KAG4125600.1 hypothetical protein ERO13_D10G106000v2 [Gossypium hirsutum]KAG4125601.1 hypothetical protein ERO13_D10G106000v2 [Gossypium hirsutum]